MATRRLKQRSTAGTRAAELLRRWVLFTWFTDNQWFGPVPRLVITWATTVILGAAWYLLWASAALPLSILTALVLCYSLGHSYRAPAKRDQALKAVFEATASEAGHKSNADPAARIQVRRWGTRNRPTVVRVTVDPNAPAGRAITAGGLEEAFKSISHPYANSGGGWILTRNKKGGRIDARAVSGKDRALAQQEDVTLLRAKFIELFKLTPTVIKRYPYAVQAQWADPVADTEPQLDRITFTYAGHDVTSREFRDTVERSFDAQMLRAEVEWLYRWGTRELTITAAGVDTQDAHRKRAERWINDVAAEHAPKSKLSPTATVTEWFDLAVDNQSSVPKTFEAQLEPASISGRRDRNMFEDALDESLGSTYPDLVWVYTWITGDKTTVRCSGFAADTPEAGKKLTNKKFRGAVEDQFGARGKECAVECSNWVGPSASAQSAESNDDQALSASGEWIPTNVRVKFAIDASKAETRDKFEDHFDSLTSTVDWKYQWDSATGQVEITAVPILPTFVQFPKEGTAEFDEFLELAKQGKILFGPRRRGGVVIWDMTKVPHGMFGGQTGAGKSYALGLPLFAALYLPEHFDIVGVDPKKVDFTWMPEFPNVLKFGAADEEIVETIRFVSEQMEYRQSRCGRRGVRNLEQLRVLYRKHPEMEEEDGPCPKRLLLFFDEIADFMAKGSDKEVEEVKAEATAMLEKLARLARAMEINMITAAQKPAADIISTQFRSQLGFRMCVGYVDPDTSKQIILSNHGTRFPRKNDPPGLAWVYDSKDGYRMVQVMYLPNDTEASPVDKTVELAGSKDMVRQRLRDLGWQEVFQKNKYGGDESRWIEVDSSDIDAEVETPATIDMAKTPDAETMDRSSEVEPASGPAMVPAGVDDFWDE